MAQSERLYRLVARCYEAGSEPAEWPRFAGELADALSAVGCAAIVSRRNAKDTILWAHGGAVADHQRFLGVLPGGGGLRRPARFVPVEAGAQIAVQVGIAVGQIRQQFRNRPLLCVVSACNLVSKIAVCDVSMSIGGHLMPSVYPDVLWSFSVALFETACPVTPCGL